MDPAGLRPRMSIRSYAGTGRSPLTICQCRRWPAPGRRGVIAGDVRRGEVGPLIVAAKQANNPKGAESVSEGAGQGKRGTATCAPDAEPGKHVTEAAHGRGSCEAAERTVFTALFHLLTVEAREAAFLPEQESGCRSGWHQVDGLRRKT